MSKKVLYALLLIAFTVIILVVNRGSVNLNLLVFEWKTMESFAFLAFTAIGVAIGVLLK